jgi:hypothetical protein
MLADARAQTSRNLPVDMGADLWLKADEGLELYEGGNGTVVSTWQSKVGNLTATQSSSESARIEGNQTTTNNKEAIFFPQGNGASGYGYFEIPSNFNLKNSTVLVSLKYEGSAFAPRILSFLSNNDTIGQDGIYDDALALMHFRNENVFRVESNGIAPKSPTYSTGNWTILSYRIDGNGNMTVALNGDEGNQISNPSMSAQNTAGKIHIARPGIQRPRNAENLANAHIYEILIFNEYLSNTQYGEALDYMQESMDASSVEIGSLPTVAPIERGSLLIPTMLIGGNASSNGTAVNGNFTWKNSATVTQSGNYSVIFQPTLAKYNFVEFEIPVIVKPELSVAPESFTIFKSRNGTASRSQSISISGTNLTSNITISISPETGFEVSTNNSTFGPNANIPVISGNASASLYVRLAAAQTSGGNKTATLNIPFGDQNKAFTLQGRVVEASAPYIEVTPGVLTLPVTTAGMPSASANFTVNAYNLSGNLTANATAGLEISLGNGTFSQTLEIPLIGGNVTNALLNLRAAASASAGPLSGSVFLTSGNTTASLSANGTVNATPLPTPTTATENSKSGKKIKKQKLKKKPKKKKNSLFTFPRVVATSGSTWITADGRVVSENQRSQSNNSK